MQKVYEYLTSNSLVYEYLTSNSLFSGKTLEHQEKIKYCWDL